MKQQTVRSHTFSRIQTKLAVMAFFAAILLAVPFHAALAQTAPDLGSAANFGVLAGTAVTCTDSTIVGDVGVSPGSVVTQTNCTVIGTVHVNDPAAIAANADFFDAYDALASEACGTVLTGPLTGVTLAPGVYCFDGAATLTGVLTLDALGDANAVWIFKIGTLGTGALTGTNFSVVMANGGQPCNVYWWVADAATMTASSFKGNVLAGDGTTVTGGSFMGRDFAKAAVTLTGADMVSCSNIVPPPPPPTEVCKDKVTGGGWIKLPSGGKGTFGVTGGIKHDRFWGHLTYVDHGPKGSKGKDMKVKGTGVTAYLVVDAVTRHIEGTATINGKAGYTYQVDVVDNGEPGRGDMFSLRLSNGYTASGYLAGGNIKLHKKCRPLICQPYDKDDDDHDKDRDRDRDKDHDKD